MSIQQLEVWLWKRDVLPDGHEYKDTKFDGAYAYQLLSDDEDAPVSNLNEPQVFISHGPLYHSKLVSHLET